MFCHVVQVFSHANSECLGWQCHLVVQSTTLVQSEIPEQLLDEFAYTVVQTFMVPRG